MTAPGWGHATVNLGGGVAKGAAYSAKADLLRREVDGKAGVLALQETHRQDRWWPGWSTAAAPGDYTGVMLAVAPAVARSVGLAEGAPPRYTADPDGRWVRAALGEITYVVAYAPVDPRERREWACTVWSPLLESIEGPLVAMGDLNEEYGEVLAAAAAAGLTDGWADDPPPTRVARPGTAARAIDYILSRGVELGPSEVGLPISDHKVVLSAATAPRPRRDPHPTMPRIVMDAKHPDVLRDIVTHATSRHLPTHGPVPRDAWDRWKRDIITMARKEAKRLNNEHPATKAVAEARRMLEAAATSEEEYAAARDLHENFAQATAEDRTDALKQLSRDWRTVSRRLVRAARPRRRSPFTTEAECVIAGDNKIVKGEQEVTDLLTQRYTELYAAKDINRPRLLRRIQALRDARGPLPAAEWSPWTEAQVKTAVCSYRRTAAAGADGLPPAFWVEAVNNATVLRCLTDIYNQAARTGGAPPSWKGSKTLLLHKGKLPLRRLDGWRPIALSAVDYRCFAALAVRRSRAWVAHVVGDEQAGFLPGRSPVAHIWTTLAWLAEPTGAVAFFDLAAAYDTLPQQLVYDVLNVFGFPHQLAKVAKVAMKGCWTRVQDPNGEWTPRITLSTGIRQGCPIAPLFFILGLAPLTAELAAADMQPKAMADDLRVHAAITQADALSAILRAWESDTATADQSYAYLGWAAATTEAAAAAATWKGVERKLTKTTAEIRRLKNTTVSTRQLLAAALMQSVVRYYGQFSRPSDVQLRRLQWLVHVAVWNSGSPAATTAATQSMHELKGPTACVNDVLRQTAHAAVARAVRTPWMRAAWMQLVAAKARTLAGWKVTDEEVLMTATSTNSAVRGSAALRNDWTWSSWTRFLAEATVSAERELPTPARLPLRATTLTGGRWTDSGCTAEDYAGATLAQRAAIHSLENTVRRAAAAGAATVTSARARDWTEEYKAAETKAAIGKWAAAHPAVPAEQRWKALWGATAADTRLTRRMLARIWKRSAPHGAFAHRTLLRAWPTAARLSHWMNISDRCKMCRSGRDETDHWTMECTALTLDLDDWAGRHDVPAEDARALYWGLVPEGTALSQALEDAMIDATARRMKWWHLRGYPGPAPKVTRRAPAPLGRAVPATRTLTAVCGYANCNHHPRCQRQTLCRELRRKLRRGGDTGGVIVVPGISVAADGRVEPNDDSHPARRRLQQQATSGSDDAPAAPGGPTEGTERAQGALGGPPARRRRAPLPILDIPDTDTNTGTNTSSVPEGDPKPQRTAGPRRGRPAGSTAPTASPTNTERVRGHAHGAPYGRRSPRQGRPAGRLRGSSDGSLDGRKLDDTDETPTAAARGRTPPSPEVLASQARRMAVGRQGRTRALGPSDDKVNRDLLGDGYACCNHHPRCRNRTTCSNVRRRLRSSTVHHSGLPMVVPGIAVRGTRVERNDDAHPARVALGRPLGPGPGRGPETHDALDGAPHYRRRGPAPGGTSGNAQGHAGPRAPLGGPTVRPAADGQEAPGGPAGGTSPPSPASESSPAPATRTRRAPPRHRARARAPPRHRAKAGPGQLSRQRDREAEHQRPSAPVQCEADSELPTSGDTNMVLTVLPPRASGPGGFSRPGTPAQPSGVPPPQPPCGDADLATGERRPCKWKEEQRDGRHTSDPPDDGPPTRPGATNAPAAPGSNTPDGSRPEGVPGERRA